MYIYIRYILDWLPLLPYSILLYTVLDTSTNGSHKWFISHYYTTWAILASHRADWRFARSQWEMTLLCNDVSHWLVASLKLALHSYVHHDDVIKWRHFPRYWPFVRGIHRSPVNSPHKGQWRGALMFSLTCTWINGCVNNCEAGDLRCHRAHYDVIVMMESPNLCQT